MISAGLARLSELKLHQILLLALVLRLAWALLVPVIPQSDSAIYDLFAREIAAGRGYVFPAGNPTVYWPVGPSALYGLVYAIFGVDPWPIVALNLLIGLGIVAAVYHLAERTFGAEAASVAALLVAAWPTLIQFTTIFSSELPFLLLLTGALLVRLSKHKLWVRSSLASALLVAASFMRPTALPLILILPLLDLVRHRQAGRAIADLAVAAVVAALLLAPWVQRNQAIFGSPVLISANFGVNLWMGNNPRSTGAYMPLPEIGPVSEVERDAMFKDKALKFIASHPGDYARLSLARIGLSFGRETIGIVWNQAAIPTLVQMPLKAISSAYWLLAFLLSWAGVAVFLLGDPRRIMSPLIVVPGLFVAVAILVVGQDRYHLPILPFVALFAALAIIRLLGRRPSAEDGGGMR